MSPKKGSAAKRAPKSTKSASKRSLRNLDVMNDKSRNVKGGAMKKITRD